MNYWHEELKTIGFEQAQKLFKDIHIKNNNINTVIPSILFFTNALEVNNELAQYCISTAKEYLDSIDFEKWKKYFENTSTYEIQLSLLLPDYEFTPAMVDAIKYSLERVAKKEIEVVEFSQAEWDSWGKLISKTSSDSKQTAFKNVRDLYCTNIDVDIYTFRMIGGWLFEFGNLEVRSESLRRILKTEIIRDNDCRKIISDNKGRLKVILDNTDEAEVNDFKSTIREFLDKDDEYAIEIAKEVGIRKSKKKEKDSSSAEE